MVHDHTGNAQLVATQGIKREKRMIKGAQPRRNHEDDWKFQRCHEIDHERGVSQRRVDAARPFNHDKPRAVFVAFKDFKTVIDMGKRNALGFDPAGEMGRTRRLEPVRNMNAIAGNRLSAGLNDEFEIRGDKLAFFI